MTREQAQQIIENYFQGDKEQIAMFADLTDDELVTMAELLENKIASEIDDAREQDYHQHALGGGKS